MYSLQNIHVLVLVPLLIVMSSCAMPRGLTVNDMSCPDSPNCVSSHAKDASHYIEPFVFSDQPAQAMQRLKEALQAEKRLSIVTERPAYLHAEVRSLVFRFVDDVEFALVEDKGLIHVRSAARTGHSDFGVNRRRIERIRQRFQSYAKEGITE